MAGAGVAEGEVAAEGTVGLDNAVAEGVTKDEGEEATGGVRAGVVCTGGGMKSMAGQGLRMLANSC